MCLLSISEALGVSTESEKSKIDQLQANLEQIPDTFFALFWLYTHDFLYVSPSIERVTGHSLKNFEKHGMVFFTGIIPPHLIENIYQTMYVQADAIQNHPDYLFAEEFLQVKAAVFDANKNQIPVTYNAVLLDERIFDPISYLVLCSWIDTREKSAEEVQSLEKELRTNLTAIKQVYFHSKPERFEFLKIKNKISDREKEVAKLIAQGHSTKSISEQLHISFNTVESHRKNLLHKLEAKNTAELVYKFNQI